MAEVNGPFPVLCQAGLELQDDPGEVTEGVDVSLRVMLVNPYNHGSFIWKTERWLQQMHMALMWKN